MAGSHQDGCYAWMVCAASFLVLVVQGGLVYSMGVFYIMFQQGIEAGEGELSLVTSINYSVLYLICPFVGILTEKLGERPLAIFGAIIATLGLVFSSIATQPFHLYLSYGVITGLGFGSVFNPCTSIIAKYFNKYTRAATGIAVCGNGIGSFIFPPIIKALEDQYGWRGALLLCAGIYAQVIVFTCLYRPPPESDVVEKHIVTPRDQPLHSSVLHVTGAGDDPEVQVKLVANEQSQLRNRKKGDVLTNGSLDTDSLDPTTTKCGNKLDEIGGLFRNIPFTCLCIHSALTLFPTVLVYTHLGNYVLTIGFTKADVVLIYMAIGITTTIARVLLGISSEFLCKAMPTAAVLGSALINGVITALLPLTSNLTLIYIYGIVFSFMLSPYNVFCLPLIIDYVSEKKVAFAYGMTCFFCVPGTALGAPLAAWLHGFTKVYASSFYLAGGLFFMSGLFLIPSMWILLRYQSQQENQNLPNKANLNVDVDHILN